MVSRVIAYALLAGAAFLIQAQERALAPSNYGGRAVSPSGQPTVEIPTSSDRSGMARGGQPTVEIPTYQAASAIESSTEQSGMARGEQPAVEVPTYQAAPAVGSATEQHGATVAVQSKLHAAPAVRSSADQPRPTTVAQSKSQAALPQSAWLDLRQNVAANSTTQSAPDWVTAIGVTSAAEANGGAPKTIFHIQLAHPSEDYQVLFFRLLFDDKAGAQPELVARDDSGTTALRSGALGAGIDLPSSDSVVVPMTGISKIDIEVPGDGKTVRGAYLDWMTSSDVVHPLSAEHRDLISAPFSLTTPLHSPGQDTEQFGTVTATLAAETLQIGSSIQEGAAFQFGLEAQPLLALLTFEVASPRIDAPPEVYVNGEDIGPVTLMLPELADPGYRGEMGSLVKEMRFQYTGWLRAQKMVPVSSLKVGTNDVIVLNGAGSSRSAIRGTQIQLKYLWEKSDYLLQPAH